MGYEKYHCFGKILKLRKVVNFFDKRCKGNNSYKIKSLKYTTILRKLSQL